MYNQQHLLKDGQFLKVAYRQGYQRIDFEQPNQQAIQQQSTDILKNMSDIESKFYIRKKIQALNLRRDNIFKKVYQQYLKNINKTENKRKKIFNPAVTQLLVEHQQMLNKIDRYQERIRANHSRNNNNNNRYANARKTIDLGRTSPNFGEDSRYSQQSRKTVRSSSSSRNSQLSRNSHKDRLQLVRNKQRQIQRFKKDHYLQQQNKSRQKIDRVYFQRQSQSRKLKTRSQISRQAARQKQADLNFVRNEEIKHHIQNLQYKMFKHEILKEKQIQQKINKTNHDIAYKKQIKNMFENNDYLKKKTYIENKMKNAQQKRQQIQQQKRNKLSNKIQQRQYKELHSHKYKQHKQVEILQRNKMTLYYEQASLEKAEKKRNQYQSEKKIKLLNNKVKQQIVKNNRNSLQRRRKIQTQDKVRQYSEKVNEIRQIQKLKKQLANQRIHYKGSHSKKSKNFSLY